MKLGKVREEEGKKPKLNNIASMHFTLSLTSCWRSSFCTIGRSEWRHTPSLPQPRSRPASVLLAAAACEVQGEGQPHYTVPQIHVCVCVCICRYAPHHLKITSEDLWATDTTSSFLQCALNVCQRSGIWSWHMKFSYVITENYISLLDRFSDVQLCFLYPKVPKIEYFLYMLCKQTHRHDFESNKKIQSIMETLNESNITTHFLLPAFVLLRTPLLRSS